MKTINQCLRIQTKVNKYLRPPPKLNLSEWADEKRVLSREASSERGRWVTSRAPFQKEVLDTISNSDYEKIVVMSATQMLKTEMLLNTIGYYIDQDPSPILLVQPTLDLGRTFSTDRLSPMLRDTPAIRN